MAVNESAEPSVQPRRTVGQWAKQMGLFVLFSALLIIPRIRRLRRRVWAWSFVRLAVAACATWLGWRYKHAGAGPASLVLSLLLFGFSLIVRAKPEEKSVDVLARELNALIVLNGGTFRQSSNFIPVERSQIFVHPEQILVVGRGERPLLDIPLMRVRNILAHSVSSGAGKSTEDWELEITWLADASCTTTFRYAGMFAEHLARVAESTLRSQWKKELPVIQQ